MYHGDVLWCHHCVGSCVPWHAAPDSATEVCGKAQMGPAMMEVLLNYLPQTKCVLDDGLASVW